VIHHFEDIIMLVEMKKFEAIDIFSSTCVKFDIYNEHSFLSFVFLKVTFCPSKACQFNFMGPNATETTESIWSIRILLFYFCTRFLWQVCAHQIHKSQLHNHSPELKLRGDPKCDFHNCMWLEFKFNTGLKSRFSLCKLSWV